MINDFGIEFKNEGEQKLFAEHFKTYVGIIIDEAVDNDHTDINQLEKNHVDDLRRCLELVNTVEAMDGILMEVNKRLYAEKYEWNIYDEGDVSKIDIKTMEEL